MILSWVILSQRMEEPSLQGGEIYSFISIPVPVLLDSCLGPFSRGECQRSECAWPMGIIEQGLNQGGTESLKGSH